MFMQVYQDTPGVEHIPVVQIDLSVPLKVPGKPRCDYTFFMKSIALAYNDLHTFCVSWGYQFSHSVSHNDCVPFVYLFQICL